MGIYQHLCMFQDIAFINPANVVFVYLLVSYFLLKVELKNKTFV